MAAARLRFGREEEDFEDEEVPEDGDLEDIVSFERLVKE